jgi:tRNA (guanine-N7-)-methyltransferase
MPNIQTKSLNLKVLPQEKDGYTFHYTAKAVGANDTLLFTTFEDKSFFLKIIEREEDILIKHDKLTRISPIHIIKNGLKAFKELHDLEVTFSNIESKKEAAHLEKSDKYLKKVSYFAHEFQTDKEIWVEVGFGSGRHLLHQAVANPHIQFIGLEIHGPSIEQVIKQCKIQEIDNLLIAAFDARIFLEFLPSNSVGKIFVHFPVPWDKKPHRRVISKAFIDESTRVLKKSGTLELRTDSENYYAYAYETFISLSQCDLQIRKNQSIAISSKYEDRWRREEKNIYDITLTNYTESAKKAPLAPLSFKKMVDFSKIVANFSSKVYKGDDYFVHFERVYKIGENSGIIKLSFGAFEKCEHKYLIFNDNKIQYFPYEALPIKQNLKSHQKIEEFLYEQHN